MPKFAKRYEPINTQSTMKRIIPKLVLLLALLLSATAHAHDFEVDGIYYNINGTNATVTYSGTNYWDNSNKYSGSVTIPTSVTYSGMTYPVTAIGDGAFLGCKSLTSINIPNSVTDIGDVAFRDCSSLTTVNIPNSITVIGDAVFRGCSSLACISVTSNNPNYDSRNSCNAIIETATNTLIAGCKNTTIPNSVTAIGHTAFADCSCLTYINIPNSVTAIGNYAFSGCSSLINIYIPNSITTIGYDAFERCSNLTSISIPNSITTISYGMFSDCSSLTSINIPNSVTSIGSSVFRSCSSLARINIPNSVTSIGAVAFASCSSLTSIVIPNSVTNLGHDNENEYYYGEVFYGCTSLTDVTIGDSVTEIGDWMFYGCTSLKNIHIGNSVKSIGYEAFSGCNSLTSITLPKSIEYINGLSFVNCPSLAIVNITDLEAWCRINSFLDVCGDDHEPSTNNPLYYTHHLYVNGTEITDLVIPESVPYIGTYVFECCPSLNSVTIPNTITSIGWGAFYGCTGLTSVAIPNSTTAIGWDSFFGCTSLKDLYLGNSVATIQPGAFYHCPGLKNIYCFSTTPPVREDGMLEALFSDYSATLHVPAASLAAYFTAPEWSKFENIVGDAIETTGISISRDSIEIHSGEQIELTATITPANASCKEVTWYSTNTSVATVENGKLTAKGIGECDIIAYCMGMPAICHISVSNRISLEQQEAMLLPNHMLVLTPTAPAMPAGFTVTSSDPNVAAARVMNGKVQIVGIKEGTTTITVASSDGTAQAATCLVTVYTESGDANCDGFVNISDVTSLIDYLLGSETAGFKEGNADLNGDGNVNISDVTELIDHLLSASD